MAGLQQMFAVVKPNVQHGKDDQGRDGDTATDVEVTETKLEYLQEGDQIAVSGNKAGVEYFHHGIYLGPDGVAEFASEGICSAKQIYSGADKLAVDEDKSKSKPKITAIETFTNNGKRVLKKFNYSENGCLPAKEVVKNARDIVDHPEKWGSYNLISNNCEHVATYCKTGKGFSKQVHDELPFFPFFGCSLYILLMWLNRNIKD